MNVLMLSTEFYPYLTGGLGIVSYSIAKNLVEHGVEVILILPAKNPAYFNFKIIKDIEEMNPILIAGGEKTADVQKMRKNKVDKLQLNGFISEKYGYPEISLSDETAKEIVNKIPFDLIHANDWATVRAALKIKEASQKPLIFHVHSTEFERSCGHENREIHSIEQLGLERADETVTVSKNTAEIINKRYGVDRSKIKIIYNAFESSTFPVSCIKNNKVSYKNPVVIFVGRLTRQKGPFYFLEVAKRIIGIDGNYQFIIAGDGDLRGEIDRYIQRNDLNENVNITGFLSREKLALLYSNADILLLPSVYEPFGIVAFEAMCFGVLPIVSKNSGILEIAEWLPSFDYWDIDQAVNFLISLFNKRRLLRKYLRRSARTVRCNSWKRRIDEVIGVYEKLAGYK